MSDKPESPTRDSRLDESRNPFVAGDSSPQKRAEAHTANQTRGVLNVKSALADEKLGLYFMVFLANMGWGVMSPILGNLKTEFGVSMAEVALASSAFGLARLVMDLPIGLLMDRIDQRVLRFAGAAVLSAGSLLCALAPSFPIILFGRLVTGFGAAIVQVTNLVWISRLSTDERRGRDLGIYQAIFQAGASISPIASGFLADWGTWRASFWFAAVMALLAFVPMLKPKAGWIERLRQSASASDLPYEFKATSGSRNRALSALVVANVVSFVLFFSVGGFQNTVTPLYGSQILNLDPGAIGLALGVSTLLRFGMSIVGGELSDRFGRRVVLIPGLIVIGLGTLVLTMASDLVGFWIAIIVVSFGRFGNNVPATVLADHSPPNRWGLMMGVNRAVGDLGAVLGPVTMGLMLDSHGYGATMLFSAAIVWASALMVIVGVSESLPRQPINVIRESRESHE